MRRKLIDTVFKIEEFRIDEIVSLLNVYKDNLDKLYTWGISDDVLSKLAEIDVDLEYDRDITNSYFHLNVHLKQLISKYICENATDKGFLESDSFKNLCNWIIAEWGGIKTNKDINDVINKVKLDAHYEFKGIASRSKIEAFMKPKECVIYDSRVAFSLNWIILLSGGEKYFPIPEGRNSKIKMFDMNLLIRMKHLKKGSTIKELKLLDKTLFVDKDLSYSFLNKLIKEINLRLWDDDIMKENLYYTEMLLFAIADNEIIYDIMNRSELMIIKN